MVHGVIRSKGLTTHYKAPFYPNICQHLGPCHNTSHQYTYLDSLLQCLLHGGTKCLTIRYKGQGKPKCYHNYIYMCIYIYIHTHMYRVSQEECARFREGVSYVKVYRCNPKHLCPKLKGYGDNGQRKVWSSGGSTRCTCQLTSLIDVCPWVWCPIQLTLAVQLCSRLIPERAVRNVTSVLAMHVSCIVLGTLKDNYDVSAGFFVVQFIGLMSLTS